MSIGPFGKGSSETTTTTLSQEDADQIRATRAAGEATAGAATGGEPWAQPIDPLTGQAIDQYQGQYDQYGNFIGDSQGYYGQASEGALQTGLEGIGDYMNPMLAEYMSSMDPEWQQRIAEANQMAEQQASGPGQAFGQNSRSGLLAGRAISDVQRAQMADYGNRAYGAARDAAGFMMGERGRLGGLAGMYGGMGLNALAGQRGVSGDIGRMGEYRRGVGREQAMDDYARQLAGLEARRGSYGKDISTSTTDEKEGDFLGDLLSTAGTVGSIMLPGAGAAAGILGSLGGGEAGDTSLSPQPAQTPWGGGYSFPLGS